MAVAQSIRVMIVDDSAVYRGVMRQALAKDSSIQIVASATNGQNAIDELSKWDVDVVLLDLEMPVMDGLTAIPRIHAKRPHARIVVASAFTAQGSERAVQALTSGASDCVQKPTTLGQGLSIEEYGKQLVAKVKQFARPGQGMAPTLPVTPAVMQTPFHDGMPELLVIGSSTGGPNALTAFFKALPKKLPFPVALVQHMPPGFTQMLAQRLQADCGIPCVEATNEQPLRPGVIHVAPGDKHLVIVGSQSSPVLRLTLDAPENFCRPAVDPLFRSAAKVYGPGVLAVVLTGMGDDGARGSIEVARAGGRVMIQDEGSSVVWGMPGAVFRAGVAQLILPIAALAERVTQMTGRKTT
ncbi:MAG: chemotaxis-specific protein-glutamate methyltransferase CheB [Oligoflexia bacterium]